MLLRWKTGFALTALLSACAPTMLPQSDARTDATSSADSNGNDVSSLPDRTVSDGPAPDRTSIPDVVSMDSESDVVSMDSAPDALPDSAPDALPDSAPDATPDSAPDASPDSAPDAAPDAAPDGPVACTLPLQAPLAEPMLGSPTTVMGTWTATGAGNTVTSFGCTSFGHGDDHIYPFTVSARTTFQFVVSADTGALANPMLAIRRACASSVNEVVCDLDSGLGNAGAARVTLDPGLYYVFASEYATSATVVRGGAYTLTVSVPNTAPDALCAGATTWMAGTPTAGTTNTGGTTDRSCNPTTATGPEVFYRYVVPPNTRSVITGTPLGMPAWRPYLRVRDDCATTTCLTTGAGVSAGSTATVTVENRTNVARTFIVTMGSYELGTGGAFTLSDALTMLPPVPDNANCATATMLAPIANLTMQTTVGSFETRSSSTCAAGVATGGPLTYYSMNVPAGRAIAVTVTPSPTFDPTIRIFAGCSPTTCGAYRNSFSAGVVEQASYRNTTAMDQTVIIAVGSVTAGATGTFDLSARLLPAIPANTTCASARPLDPMTPAIAQGQFDATEMNTAMCEPTAAGNVLFYSMSIPAGQTAIVTATPYSTATDPVLRVVDSCMSATCVTSSNASFGGGTEQVVIPNTGMTARDVIVTLGSRATTSAGVSDVTTRFVTAPPNATCASPTTLMAGMPLAMQDTGTALERRLTTCAIGSSGGALLYYSVTVPASAAARVRVTPTGAFNPTIRVFQTGMPASCTNYTSIAAAGAVEEAVWRNTGATDQTYIVAVGGVGATETGVFSIEYDNPPDPYTIVRTMGAMCEDMTMATVLASLTGDDASTGAAIALPFTFTYFGDMATHWGASTNGLMQLFGSAAGSATTTYSNADLNTPANGPAGSLAIFWDDLQIVAPANVRHLTIGSMPTRRFILEWNNVQPLSVTEPMRFQIKLSESSNVIEYHYCATAGTSRTTGDSASIGLVNLTQSRSVGVNYNTAGFATAGTLVRFIPR